MGRDCAIGCIHTARQSHGLPHHPQARQLPPPDQPPQGATRGRADRTLSFHAGLDERSRPPQARPGGLNKGEARNALAPEVFFNRQGHLRDRSFENQRNRASGLNLIVAAIVLWNTVYLESAVAALRGQGIVIDDESPGHLSPIGWAHINLAGDYTWQTAGRLRKGAFRPLRPFAASNE